MKQIPTDKIIDERVLSSFYNMMSREAEKQGFSVSSFPAIGDLSLGELMEDLRRGDTTHYRNVIAFSNLSLPKETVYVNSRDIDQRVIDSYKNWISDIGEDRAYRKLHQTVLIRLVKEQPQDKKGWIRADVLFRKLHLNPDELQELQNLESTLDANIYVKIREKIMPELIKSETWKAANEYKLPVANISFAEAFFRIRKSADELYRELVVIHNGFEFKS